MQISYDPQATSGHQYSVTIDGGKTLTGLARKDVESLLRREGLGHNHAQTLIAEARLMAVA